MAEEVLFTITKDQLETGMRGYPIGYCTTSSVDPSKGLHYVGKPISDLAFWKPEEVIYLLYTGKEGSKEELAKFSKDLQSRALCSSKTIQSIQSLPKEGHPMKLLPMALLLAGIFEATGDYREDCLNLIAKIPQIVATVINTHAGWKSLQASKPELGYIENFTHMLNAPRAHAEELISAFRLFTILHYDHGGGNLSTFVGKAVASGMEDMYGSMSAAMNGLAGSKHGRANQDCLEFLELALQELGDDPSPKSVEEFVRKRLANKELVHGFGHAVLRVEDSRATIFYQEASKRYPKHPLVKMALLMRTEGSKVLKENPKISNPYPNVDAISGSFLTAAGFPYPEYYTVLFGLARVVGIAIQTVYERCEAREGKGTPIIRPKYLYKARGSA